MNRARAVLATAAAAHILHDGLSEAVYVLLPVWAAELRLTLWQVGAIRSGYSGGMAVFQIPAGLVAERRGERWLLGVGTAVTALAYLVVGAAGSFPALLALLLLAGLGSGVQHPLASALVARAYEGGPRRAALGTYNFAGDLGKVASAAAVGLVATLGGWRVATAGLGGIGLLGAVALVLMLARLGAGGAPAATSPAGLDGGPVGAGWGIRDEGGFRALAAIGMIDNATRSTLITFLPFVLIAKGLTVAGVGGALALLFAGGAAGKFVCGVLAERLGIVRVVVLTEAATSLAIVTVLVAPLPLALATLIPLGIALNGTSSVLYATVADLVTADRRSRAYGLFYTLGIAASALGPILWGVIGDAAGVPVTLTLVAALLLVTIPLGLGLRPALAQPALS